jgi:hypothetical protein
MRRLRKRLARLVVVLAERAPTYSQKQAENAPDSKTNYATAFFDSIGQKRKSPSARAISALPPNTDNN